MVSKSLKAHKQKFARMHDEYFHLRFSETWFENSLIWIQKRVKFSEIIFVKENFSHKKMQIKRSSILVLTVVTTYFIERIQYCRLYYLVFTEKILLTFNAPLPKDHIQNLELGVAAPSDHK